RREGPLHPLDVAGGAGGDVAACDRPDGVVGGKRHRARLTAGARSNAPGARLPDLARTLVQSECRPRKAPAHREPRPLQTREQRLVAYDAIAAIPADRVHRRVLARLLEEGYHFIERREVYRNALCTVPLGRPLDAGCELL